MPQFLTVFPQISETDKSAGFLKGLATAMIELGALIGSLNQGWIADRISRKYSIVMAVGVFGIGSAMQTVAAEFGMLVTARFVGGVGVGMLSTYVFFEFGIVLDRCGWWRINCVCS